MKENIISIRGVKKYFKDVKAVDGISLEINRGDYVALLGPNGAGKTTLVEMVEGIQFPDEGEIEIDGLHWKGHQEALHRKIGLSLQETRFMDKLSVYETLQLFSSFYGYRQEKVDETMETVNLSEKKKTWVEKLSGGQRQRLALGIALLNDPELLLLDEPTTGLDPTARRELWDILTQLREEKKTTMILTTHYMEEASHLCERIIIMDQGKILAQGTLKDLLNQFKNGEVIDFSISNNIGREWIPNSSSIKKMSFDQDGYSGKIVVDDIVSFLPGFLDSAKENNVDLTSLECRKMTLDDLFIAMTGRKLSE